MDSMKNNTPQQDLDLHKVAAHMRRMEEQAEPLAFDAYFGQTTFETLERQQPADIMEYVRARVAELESPNLDLPYDGAFEMEFFKKFHLERILLGQEYASMLTTFEHYEIDPTGAPSKEAIQKALTFEVLQKATRLKKPRLLLIPPTTRQEKVEAINAHPVSGQWHHASILAYPFDNDLWNGGKPETERHWRVSIVEGVQNVPQDPKIYDGKKTNDEMAKEWVAKLEVQGLDVMNDADTYLTLMMKGLAEDKPIDANTYTILNAQNMTKFSRMAYGDWSDDVVSLFYVFPADSNPYLRLRGSVRVDVPTT